MRLLDEAANKGRSVPRGNLTLLDILLMEPFERQALVQDIQEPVRTAEKTVAKIRRKKSKYSKELSKQLKIANKLARTKSGKLRKGMTPGKILKKAHKAAKRRFK